MWRIRQAGSKRVALQFPEGLLLYSCVISDIVERFTGADTIILGDVRFVCMRMRLVDWLTDRLTTLLERLLLDR